MEVDSLRKALKEGHVIPAHPLALTSDLELDEQYQRGLTRYYLASGAGGLAVGVHTTQFEIHDEDVGLYQPVLEMAMEEVEQSDRRPIMIAGLVGSTKQAAREARLARELGYDCGLLSLGALPNASIEELITHASTVADELPIVGFYLQQAVGGRLLPYTFWRQFADIESVVAIKMAPFDRYETLDVVRAVADAGRLDEIALYTGNDDNIVVDLLTPFPWEDAQIVGGLLGHWAVWTRKAVELLSVIKETHRNGHIPPDLLKLNAEVTDANAAFFDPFNSFSGSIAGIHEVLRRQGLLRGRWCLSPKEKLSPGQMEEIDRVYEAYPHLNDDEFVHANLDKWLS